jgi:hypothetical protein
MHGEKNGNDTMGELDECGYQFVFYQEKYRNVWEEFVEKNSANGTFLQTRRFMDYHLVGQFQDCSILIFNRKNKLTAVCPANEYVKDGKHIFMSYQGATFGGPVVAKKYYKAKYILPLIQELTMYLIESGYDEIWFRPTADLFTVTDTALLEYAFCHVGYQEFKELSTFIDYDDYNQEVITNLDNGKRGHVRACEKEGLVFKTIETREEIKTYYEILCENLNKYGIKPVHSLEELYDLKYNRLQDEVAFFGTYKGKQMIAGGMVFFFERTRTVHTQYLSAKQDSLSLSPMTYTYYKMICEMQQKGYRKISWGTVTEDLGRYLNQGLVASKEAFGSKHCMNRIYYYRNIGS